MEIDENDLLFTNEFIKTPSIKEERLSGTDYSTEFQRYYVEQNKKVKEPSITQSIKESTIERNDSKRYKREVKTYISIDSRNRDTILYPTPSHFKIFLGKTFYNVRSVRMASMEFPNTNAVINSTNNNIYWINQEDIDLDIIDTVTQTYPIYNVKLRIGSYIATKLKTEIDSKLHLIKRKNKTGDFHYFITDLDIETDVVSFISLIIKQLPAGPLATTASTGLIKVSLVAHGYSTGEVVYIIGARTVAGIGSSFLNGPQTITVLNPDEFQYEIQVKATTTDSGGGSNVKSGKLAPFQLLFGDYQQTVSKNIGYLYENSSEQIIVNIKSMDNFIQVQITTDAPHGLLRNETNVGSTVIVSSSNTTPNIDGTRVVTDILSDTSLLINVNSILDIPSFNNGIVIINGNTFNLTSVENFKSKTIILTTFTSHNYKFIDSGDTVRLYNTISKPSFDGGNVLYMRLSDTELILYGEILTGGTVDVVTPGDAGFTPLHNPITTLYYTILEITPGLTTTIRLTEPHDLRVGDSIKLYNVFATPNILDKTSGIHTVFSIVSSDTFTIDTFTSSINTETIELGEATIGTSILYVKFPGHGFNTITSITNGGAGTIEVETLLDHGFTSGDTVRISSTNTTPNTDGGGYIVTVLTPDTFSIPFPVPLTVSGTYGEIGISTQFQMYRVSSTGGFAQEVLNNNRFYIRDVIDEDNFSFIALNYYSSFKENGGGTGIFINSFRHGFNGIQTNTKNGIIDRSISLEGENYSFLTCPQLGTMKNTGDVKDIFARITLDQSPGMMVFNFLSNPKQFDETPLNKLEELEFSMVNFDNSFYEFNDLDYSFVLEVIEIIDSDYSFNISSKRGINDTLQ